jgi:hypothetical protein
MRRRIGEYRKDLLRTFLIKYNAIVKAMEDDPVNCRFVPVATDEKIIFIAITTASFCI